MAEIIGIDRRNIARSIKKLQEQGIVRRVGPDKGGFWEIMIS
jgi:ATP-dependent DNA helicase RecG